MAVESWAELDVERALGNLRTLAVIYCLVALGALIGAGRHGAEGWNSFEPWLRSGAAFLIGSAGVGLWWAVRRLDPARDVDFHETLTAVRVALGASLIGLLFGLSIPASNVLTVALTGAPMDSQLLRSLLLSSLLLVLPQATGVVFCARLHRTARHQLLCAHERRAQHHQQQRAPLDLAPEEPA